VLGAVALQGRVDLVREPEQGEFAQCGEVAEPEVVAERRVHPGRGIDDTRGEPVPQRLRSEVDELDLVGRTQHGIGDRLALDDAGDLAHDIVERLDVLDVDR
jgi:hypothetical protein